MMPGRFSWQRKSADDQGSAVHDLCGSDFPNPVGADAGGFMGVGMGVLMVDEAVLVGVAVQGDGPQP
jgi:hypothetical protein